MYSVGVRIIFFLFLIATIPVFANAQAKCPKVEIIGPAGITAPGDVANFAVSSDLLNIDGLKFSWIVSDGVVESRQGEPHLAVRTGTMAAISSITVSLEVTGLPADCPAISHETFGVGPGCGLPPMIDEWERLSPNDERGRLDLVAAAWKETTNSVVMAVLYRTKRETVAAYNARVARIKKHLIDLRKFPSDKLTIVQAGFRERSSSQFYLVQEAAKDVLASSVQTNN